MVSAVASPRTAADISVMLGNRTIRVTTGGSSSQSQVMSPMGGSMGSSENEQLREVPLMTQAALGQLPGHGSVIFTRRAKPILATKAIYFTRKDMRDRVKSPESVQDELDVTRRRKAVLQACRTRRLRRTPPPRHIQTPQRQPAPITMKQRSRRRPPPGCELRIAPAPEPTGSSAAAHDNHAPSDQSGDHISIPSPSLIEGLSIPKPCCRMCGHHKKPASMSSATCAECA